MIKYLIEKEFKQIFRNRFLPRLILGFPCITLLLMPWAANFEVKNINISIVDNDHSSCSRRLADKIVSSGYFKLIDIAENYAAALENIELDSSDVILEIPDNFESDLTVTDKGASLMISSNAVNGTKGALSASYLAGIIRDFSAELRRENPSPQSAFIPVINIIPQYRFNPNLDYKIFMVPALMVMLLTMLCGFLPALNIVGEKEAGTMEQINVTPVKKHIFILAKLIPYWVIGFFILTLGFGIAFFVYSLMPAGSFLTIYVFSSIYVLIVSGFGLVISNYSKTMQQGMFVMYFFILILILISGMFTPVNSTPWWAKIITVLNPLKYFIEVMRSVYLMGSGFTDLFIQFIALCVFAVIFNVWAVLSYSKKS